MRKSALICALMVVGCAWPLHGIDLDGDEVSDVFERIYSVEGDSPDTDLDQDGFTLRAEYLFGGDPTTGNDLLDLTWFDGPTNDLINVYWNADEGLRFQVEVSDNLISWAGLTIHTTTGVEQSQQIFVSSGAKLFWRIRGWEPLDEDEDLLNSWEEATLGTDAGNADSEPGGGDGLPDGYEWFHGLDPLANDAGLDQDGDGVINAEDSNPSDEDKGALSIEVNSPFEGEVLN